MAIKTPEQELRAKTHAKWCYFSALTLGARLAKQRIECASKAVAEFIHLPYFNAMPTDIHQIIYDYLDFVDFSCLIVSCREFSAISNKDEIRWNKIRGTCVEDKAAFVKRHSEMHSWYKHLGSGRKFTFVLKPGRLTKFYGYVDRPLDDPKDRFGLCWNVIEQRAVDFPISRCIELNCFYSKCQSFISLAHAKADAMFWEQLMFRYGEALTCVAQEVLNRKVKKLSNRERKAAIKAIANQCDDSVWGDEVPIAEEYLLPDQLLERRRTEVKEKSDALVASGEYNRQVEEVYSALASVEDELFGIKVKDFL